MPTLDSFSEPDELAKKERLLIISNILHTNVNTEPKGSNVNGIISASSSVAGLPKKSRRKTLRTNNRKQITTASSFTHKGKKYRINNGDERGLPLYIELLQKIIEQFEIGLMKWRRVFVLRVELHMPHETQDNKCITGFNKRLFQRLKREYGFKDIGFSWAREYHGLGKGQHYHYALFLDGDKIRHSSRIIEFVRASWELTMGGYSIGYIKRPFYFVDNEAVAQKAIYRLSYLAKTRGKGRRPPQTKDYGTSRMKY